MTWLQSVAWLSAIIIVLATVSPIAWRPVSGLQVDLERFLVLLVAGLLFGAAYPAHPIRLVFCLLASLVALELMQLAAPGRHARLPDLLFKGLGGTLGIGLGFMAGSGLHL